MLSLPRDLWVPIAGEDGAQRINAAYAEGEQVLADTIQQFLGIPVHHYVEVDFAGFQQMVTAVDGVPVYFERAMKDENSGLDVLHPGCVDARRAERPRLRPVEAPRVHARRRLPHRSHRRPRPDHEAAAPHPQRDLARGLEGPHQPAHAEAAGRRGRGEHRHRRRALRGRAPAARSPLRQVRLEGAGHLHPAGD